MKRAKFVILFLIFLFFSFEAYGQTLPNTDWPQLGHDAQKSNASPQTINGPYRFYWRWTDVPIASRAQPVVVNNVLFIGGLNGTMYALDADEDKQGQSPTIIWQKDLGSPIRSGAGVDGTTVIVGTHHGKIYSLDTVTGNQKWVVQTDGAILAAPLIEAGTAYLGSADGNFYAINISNGSIKWKHPITDSVKGNIPILGSAAISTDGTKIFFVAENVKAYALNTSNGSEVWSQQLQGQSGTDRWPVVLGNTVAFRTQAIRHRSNMLLEGDTIMDNAGVLLSDWTADWNIVKPQIVNNLTNNPVNQTFFVFDINTGQSKGVAPVLATFGAQDAPAPPLVYNQAFYLPYRARHGIQTDGGSIHVSSKYDAELGKMDPATLDIAGLTSSDQFTYQFRMTSDENAVLSMMGDTLLVDSWERIGGLNLTSGILTGIAQVNNATINDWSTPYLYSCAPMGVGGPMKPFYDVCPAKVGSALGGTVIGEGWVRTGAVVASGRIFWVAGSFALGLGAIGTDNGSVATIPLPTADPRPTIGPLPGPVSTPSAQALANYVWNEPQRPVSTPADLLQKLEQEIQKIVNANNHLMPFYLEPGTHGTGSWPPDTTNPPEPANIANNNAFWYDPGELVLTLSLAYPYLNPVLQGQLRTYLQTEMNLFPPLQNLPYCCTAFDWKTQGQARELYPVPTITRNYGSWPPPATPIQTIYALWAYGKYTGDWTYVQAHWDEIKTLFNAKRSAINSYAEIAGAIGYARIARQIGFTADATDGENVAVLAMQNGFDFATWLSSANSLYTDQAGSGASSAGRKGRRGAVFFGLIPEVGQYLRDTNLAAVDYTLLDLTTSFDGGAYLWYATRLGIQSEFDEASYHVPDIGWSVFLAQAYVKNASQQQLRYWLDRPWGLGDPWYLQKLVATIEATPTTLPSPKGDVNNDTKVDVLDVQACVNHILGIQDLGTRADVNTDGTVNVLDVQVIVNIILGIQP